MTVIMTKLISGRIRGNFIIHNLYFTTICLIFVAKINNPTSFTMPVIRKELCDMTIEELWDLFPIVLTPHQPHWREWAEDEVGLLSVLLARCNPVINHIGSTAIPNIQAKPIIDLLVEIPPEINLTEVRDIMERNGYICMAAGPTRMSFNKGYTPDGFAEKVFHIHLRVIGDNDEIYFRDYLRVHPESAYEYETLKLSLLPKYRNNRDGYTEAKTNFVTETTRRAKQSALKRP